jgi:hypothetical protein
LTEKMISPNTLIAFFRWSYLKKAHKITWCSFFVMASALKMANMANYMSWQHRLYVKRFWFEKLFQQNLWSQISHRGRRAAWSSRLINQN